MRRLPPNRAGEAPDTPPDEAAIWRMRAYDAQHPTVQARIKEGPFNWDPEKLGEAARAARHVPEGIVKHVERTEDQFREYFTPGLSWRPKRERSDYRRAPWRPRLGMRR